MIFFFPQWVGSIDLTQNDQADANIIVDRDADWTGQETSVLDQVGSALQGDKLDAVICVAGGMFL
jgi:dihydropteridine reductase